MFAAAERDGVNMQILLPLIKKAELSRNEVQFLTDLLLNKHLENEFADHSEWIEVQDAQFCQMFFIFCPRIVSHTQKAITSSVTVLDVSFVV